MDDDLNGNGDGTGPAFSAQMTTRPAPPTPTPRRQPAGPLRLALLIAAVAGLVLAALYVRLYRPRAALLRVQQACMTYAPPPGSVVYDEQPARAAAAVRSAAGEFVALPGEGAGIGPPVAARVPAAWRAMRGWALPAAPEPGGAVLFLHARQTDVGVRGFVCVEADRVARRLRVTFIRPGGWTINPIPTPDADVRPMPQEGLVLLSPGGDPFDARLPPPEDPAARADLRFFAGRPDPKDPTHFTLPYQLGERAGELEMWVHDERTAYYVDHLYAPGVNASPPGGTVPPGG